jgi:histidyl-tRNA synthetase
MRVQRCKGTRDLTPEEMSRFRLVEGVFRDRCLKGGYREIRTPTLEYLHLFTSTGTLTPGTLRKVYSFLDWDGWSGERVVLRPDVTIPVARSYIESMSEQGLAKLFYVSNIFIFEESGVEARERWQCGVELIGAGSALADIELIVMALDVLDRLGIKDVELKLSHAGLIGALLTRFGLSPQERAATLDRILDGDEAALGALTARSPELGETLTPLLDLRGQSPGFLRNLKALFARDLPEFEPALDNFIEITDMLDAIGYRYEIDVASGRGFEYYTGIMYQMRVGDLRVAGGGRYDALVPLMGGDEIPASGFALYVDGLMPLIRPDILDGRLPLQVLVRSSGAAAGIREGLRLAAVLREAGYAAVLDLGAAQAGPRWTVDVSEERPLFTVRDETGGGRTDVGSIEAVLVALGGDGGD